jgi:hypothetical protein
MFWTRPSNYSVSDRNIRITVTMGGCQGILTPPRHPISPLANLSCSGFVFLYGLWCLLLLVTWSRLRFVLTSLFSHLFLWLVISTCVSRLITVWYLAHFNDHLSLASFFQFLCPSIERPGTYSVWPVCWLISYGFTSRSRNFHLDGDVTIAGEGLRNLGLCSALMAIHSSLLAKGDEQQCILWIEKHCGSSP